MTECDEHYASDWVEPIRVESTEYGVRILSRCDNCTTKIWEYYDKVREIDQVDTDSDSKSPKNTEG